MVFFFLPFEQLLTNQPKDILKRSSEKREGKRRCASPLVPCKSSRVSLLTPPPAPLKAANGVWMGWPFAGFNGQGLGAHLPPLQSFPACFRSPPIFKYSTHDRLNEKKSAFRLDICFLAVYLLAWYEQKQRVTQTRYEAYVNGSFAPRHKSRKDWSPCRKKAAR